jgi:hypothetical protein
MSVSMASDSLVARWVVLPSLMGGTRWYDCVSGSVGTLTSMSSPPTSTSGWNISRRPGGLAEIRFDGTDDRVSLASTNATQITSDITIAFWLKSSGPDVTFIFGSYNTASPFQGYGVGIGLFNATTLSYWSGTAAAWVGSNTIVSDNVYHHCVVSVLDTSVKFFRDGQADGTSTSARPNSYTGAQNIGARSDGTGFLNGSLDDFRIYNRALSTPEVQALYESTKRMYIEDDLFVPDGLPSKQQQADRMLLATM